VGRRFAEEADLFEADVAFDIHFRAFLGFEGPETVSGRTEYPAFIKGHFPFKNFPLVLFESISLHQLQYLLFRDWVFALRTP
jgi:hypothetical protein